MHANADGFVVLSSECVLLPPMVHEQQFEMMQSYGFMSLGGGML